MRNFPRRAALFAAIAAISILPATAWAADNPSTQTRSGQSGQTADSGSGHAGAMHKQDPMIQQMDTDGDNRISNKEYHEELQQRFEALDTDADGYLENAELHAARIKARKHRQQMDKGDDLP